MPENIARILPEIFRYFYSRQNGDLADSLIKHGVKYDQVFGVPFPEIKSFADRLGKNQPLAERLWHMDCREARLLAVLLARHDLMEKNTINQWMKDIRDRELADQFCMIFLIHHPSASVLAKEYILQIENIFIQYTGIMLLGRLARQNNTLPEQYFLEFLYEMNNWEHQIHPIILQAVEWSLQEIGKRKLSLKRELNQHLSVNKPFHNVQLNSIAKEVLEMLTYANF